jgi:hypothetical protein
MKSQQREMRELQVTKEAMRNQPKGARGVKLGDLADECEKKPSE